MATSNLFLKQILIFFLGDCCGVTLSNFNIRIGESAEEEGKRNPLCVSNAAVTQGETKTFKCAAKPAGRYLYIKTNLNVYLMLCEVKVFGELK